MRNFPEFVSWSLSFLLIMFLYKCLAEAALVTNVGQSGPPGIERVHEEIPEVTSEKPGLLSLLFGNGQRAPVQKEGLPNLAGEKGKEDEESCMANGLEKPLDKMHPPINTINGIGGGSNKEIPQHQPKVRALPDSPASGSQASAPTIQQSGGLNAQKPTGNEPEGGVKPTAGTAGAPPPGKSPLDSILEISDPSMRDSLTTLYGSVTGDPDCGKKLMCVAGNAVQGLPGRDYFFMLAGRYVPSNWAVLYDIFRISSLYGQNCDLYLCQPRRSQVRPNGGGGNGLPNSQIF